MADLVYKTSKTAKARAAADAKKKKRMAIAASAGRRTSPRKRSSVNQDNGASMERTKKKRAVRVDDQSQNDSQKVRKKVDWRKYKKICSAEGCTNHAQKGGVCIRHGAKVNDWRKYAKTCSADGCTNYAMKGGVCIKHGAKTKRCSSERCTNYALEECA